MEITAASLVMIGRSRLTHVSLSCLALYSFLEIEGPRPFDPVLEHKTHYGVAIGGLNF